MKKYVYLFHEGNASMPGMMDTILNLGLNEEVVNVISAKSGNPRWAWDCYRRFIQMFSDVVMGVGKKYFEKLIDILKEEKGVTFDVELTADDLHTLADQFKAEYKAQIGKDFPTRKSSFLKLSKRCSAPGIIHARTSTVWITIFPIPGVLRSTCR